MAGAMVPRNAGDERLIRQQREQEQRATRERREQELDRRTLAIDKLLVGYCQHRDEIRQHLQQVSDQRLFLATHKSFQEWFEASGFVARLSLRTAKRMLTENRPEREEKDTEVPNGPTSHQKGSKSPPAQKGNPVLDFFKHPLPERCRSVYLNKPLQELIDELGEAVAKWEKPEFQFALEREARQLPFHDAAQWQIDIQRVTHDLIVMLGKLKENRPIGVCPKCAGKGCETCRFCGMLPKAAYERLKQESTNGES